ncbi:hypothetical protein UP10_15510 [Bradyrhizobium sp. LTSPM299]|uniref:hypothetical protein n=1 Tax=Bradyrhizobium sp. LTSPM299 TaxID=1619233 RepID=UPI0005C9B1B8|nr:hypothetical protein [Bradyrhizobium sp. LTSPM299]KJC60073.1 hypothetical protein UP10_15510 [Bradyrhizobium sp. LTSPM299]
MVDTRVQWLKELERLSSTIHGYGLSGTQKDVAYVTREGGQSVFSDSDAFNVANSPPHNAIVVDAIDVLQGKMAESAIRVLLGELTFRKTYGAFSEVMAYKWFGDAGVDFVAQVPLTKTDVVNFNGSTLDGQVSLAGETKAYFDVKGFGFVAHKLKLLRERLETQLPGKSVLIEGDWNVSIDMLQDLHDHTGFSALLSELQGPGRATRGSLEFRAQQQRRITISAHASDPLSLARENRDYPLRFAGQYARNAPFLLVFVIHSWFSQGELHQNFGGFVDAFTKELSRLAFESFANDQTQLLGMSHADLTRLLSGLVFLNGWPAAGTDAPRPNPFCRIYLNGHAKHKLRVSHFAKFKEAFGDGLVVEEIPPPRRSSSLMAGVALLVIVAIGFIGLYLAFNR